MGYALEMPGRGSRSRLTPKHQPLDGLIAVLEHVSASRTADRERMTDPEEGTTLGNN